MLFLYHIFDLYISSSVSKLLFQFIIIINISKGFWTRVLSSLTWVQLLCQVSFLDPFLLNVISAGTSSIIFRYIQQSYNVAFGKLSSANMTAACLHWLMVLTASLTIIHPSSWWMGALTGYLSPISLEGCTNFERTLMTAPFPMIFFPFWREWFLCDFMHRNLKSNQCWILSYHKIILRDI